LIQQSLLPADLVAGGGAGRQRIGGNLRHGGGQQRLLNQAGGAEVLLHASPLDVALVERGIFKRDGGLEGETFGEVLLIEREDGFGGRSNDQLGEQLLVEGEKRETMAVCVRSGRDFAIADEGFR